MIKLPRIFIVSYSGQATLLAILIATAVAIVTAVGVTTRQNSSFRRTTYTTQTDQSFSCANSAVDAALLCITQKEKAGLSGTTCAATDIVVGPAGVDTCKYSYTVATLNDSTIKLDPLTKGNVQQLDTTNVTSLNIKWKKTTESGDQPGMEVTYAYLQGGVPNMRKYAYRCVSDPSGVSTSGFTPVNLSGGFCNVTISGLVGGVTSLIRIKPLFTNAYVEVSNFTPVNPVQGLKILAKGTAGNVVRNIVVSRMNPQLPALFDYVLYSEEGNIQK